jgi:Uma2 family endonuclease
LIQGIAYAMSPAPSRLHQQFVIHIARQLADALEESPCEVNIAPFDVRLAVADAADEAIDTVVQPDILVVCDPDKLDERACFGAPDWVIEIISPASAAHDQIRKRALYERFGVWEYWIAHPVDRLVTVYVLDKESYGRPDIHELKGRISSSILPEVGVSG